VTRFDPRVLPPYVIDFLTERHLATLTTTRADGSLHVVPVGFTFDSATSTARVITSGGSVKARNADRPGSHAALCQVDRARWLTLQGPVRVERDTADVTDAERRYAERYRQPRVNPQRVVLVMEVQSVIGSVDPQSPSVRR
jgi:PPOX class probable F420-dependent enzyme